LVDGSLNAKKEGKPMPRTPQFSVSHETAAVWRVTFHNPPMNLLDSDTIDELLQLSAAMLADKQLKIVVFQSADPDYFIAHYDMSRASEAAGKGGTPPWIEFTTRLAHMPMISLASIRGRARGVGNEFALACDLRFASLEKAIFCQPEVAVGVVPGGGAVERLPLLLGRARALEVLLGCDDIDAATAENYGMVNRAIPDAELDGFVDRLVRRIASFDRQALGTVKQLVNRKTLPSPDALGESLDTFRQSVAWEGRKRRAAPLAQRGISKRGDFELRLGSCLGDLMPPGPDVDAH
jgi:enoyl-CoA hydratase/carnithine racemase